MPHKIAGLRWDDCSTLVFWCGYICLSDRCGGFGCVLDESHVASFPQPVFATWTGESVINPEFMIKFYIVISIGESIIKSRSSILPPREGGDSPFNFTPGGGPLQSILGKSGKNTLKIRTICLIFLHCAFSNASSYHLHNRIHSHTGCIWLTFLCDFKCILKELTLEDA